MKYIVKTTAAVMAFTALCLTSVAQKHGRAYIDSLEKQLPRLKDDTTKVFALVQISGTWYRLGSDSCFAPLTEALHLSEKLHWKRGIANTHNNLGLFITDTGNYPLARQHFEQSLVLNRELDSKMNIINNLTNIGRTYSREGDLPRAAGYYFQALSVAENIKSDDHISLVTNNLCDIFYKQKDIKKARDYALMTIDHARKANKPERLMLGYHQLGIMDSELKDTAASIVAYDSAFALATRTESTLESAVILADRGLIETNLHKQLAIFQQAEELLHALSPSSIAMMANDANIASNYFSQAKDSVTGAKRTEYLAKANDYLTRAMALAETQHNRVRVAEILNVRTNVEKLEGNYKAALDDHLRLTAINDSLYSQEKKNEIAGLEGKHSLTLKDQEIALNQLTLANQRKTSIGLIAGLVVLAAFGFLLYRQNRNRKKANAALTQLNIQLYEANQVKARFFGIISHDFRGPISNLLHFLYIQKEDPGMLSQRDAERHRQELTESAENVLSTMESMLLWSKQQMEAFRPNVTTMPVDQLFEYLQKFFGQPENVRLVFDEATGLLLTTDENYLRTIMQNLTANAVKAVKNTPDAAVEWKATRTPTATILSIADNGPGLDPQQAKALMTDGPAANAPDGFGFHVIRDLAKAIDCKVEVDSRPGKGTVFLLTIANQQVAV